MPTEQILGELACPFAHSHAAHVPTYEVTMVGDVSLLPAADLLRIRFPPQWQRLHDLLESLTLPSRLCRELCRELHTTSTFYASSSKGL